METAIPRVLVLAPAIRAHREPRHGGERPVVGNVADDREPRPAVCAVDERMAKAPISRVKQLSKAVVAGRGVRGDQGLTLPGRVALDDRETNAAGRADDLGIDAVDDRQWGGVALQRGQEAIQLPRIPLDLDEDPGGVVADETGETARRCQTVDKGAEPDALHHPLHADAKAVGGDGGERLPIHRTSPYRPGAGCGAAHPDRRLACAPKVLSRLGAGDPGDRPKRNGKVRNRHDGGCR